jgi:hypothetical protein
MIILNRFIGVLINGMNETQREAEARERRKHRAQLGRVTLGDEIRLMEH